LLLGSNASGGLNPQFAVGDVVVIDDHGNRMAANPLMGVNDDRLGPRFPDMSAPYDRVLVDQALEIARRENFVAHRGVYVALSGPTYETRAEYRFLRQVGGDVVGMSTVPEVIVAVLRSAHSGEPDARLDDVLRAFRREWEALGRRRYSSLGDGLEDALQTALLKVISPAKLESLRDPGLVAPGAIVAGSLEEGLAHARRAAKEAGVGEIMVIGGDDVVVLDVETHKDMSPEVKGEIQQIVDSIQFE